MLKINWMLVITALVMASAALWCKSRSDEIVSHGVKAQGVVERVERSMRHMKNTYTYYPVINFKTTEGENITATSATGSNSPSFKEGEIIPIIYDKANPKLWAIDHWTDLWATPTAVGITALGVLVFGIRPAKKQLEPTRGEKSSESKA